MTDSQYTHIALVVDRSGSMHGIHTDMNGAILKLLADQAKEPGYALVDITTFDDVIEFPHVNSRLDDVKGEVIVPRGSTALLDAVGKTIVNLGERFAAMEEDERPGTVIFVIVTDGMENASREWTREQIKALVELQTQNYGWTFMYLAAGVDAFATGSGMGFARGQTISVAGSSDTWAASYAATSANMSTMRANASRGVKSAVDYSDDQREAAAE